MASPIDMAYLELWGNASFLSRGEYDTPLTAYGWRPVCVWRYENYEGALSEFVSNVEADIVPTVMLDPRALIPTQQAIDSVWLAAMKDVEYLPAIVVVRADDCDYIHDGHHRATRALLDNQKVRAAVFQL